MTRVPWPFPGDTALDRARRIARSYREALADVDAARCDELDTAAELTGETWIKPRRGQDLSPTGYYPANVIAEALGIEQARVRMWGHRNKVDHIHDPDTEHRLYLLGDCQTYLASSRHARRGRDGGDPGV